MIRYIKAPFAAAIAAALLAVSAGPALAASSSHNMFSQLQANHGKTKPATHVKKGNKTKPAVVGLKGKATVKVHHFNGALPNLPSTKSASPGWSH